MTDARLLFSLRLRSDPELLCVVRSVLERLTQILGFTAAEGRSVIIAVDEALTNIIRHAYQARRGRPIEMAFRRTRRDQEARSGLEITLIDYGPAIDRAKLRGRPLDEVRPGGLGLHFIQQSMDIVKYRRTGGTNQLRLVKYPSGETSG